jgi:hypothetical protein
MFVDSMYVNIEAENGHMSGRNMYEALLRL